MAEGSVVTADQASAPASSQARASLPARAGAARAAIPVLRQDNVRSEPADGGATAVIACGATSAHAGDAATAVIACGALAGHVKEIAGRRGWNLRIHSLPAILHNTPRDITPAVERLARELVAAGWRVAVAYADCGTYGELDRLCYELGLARLPGLHCYDVLAGPDRIRAALEAEPGTYLLTDFLVRSFRRSVLEPLGLDRYPELWSDYFGHYRRVVWLACAPSPELAAQAQAVAGLFGLPLTVIDVGLSPLEAALAELTDASAA
jgi:Protein of unknown function (DUF1638)